MTLDERSSSKGLLILLINFDLQQFISGTISLYPRFWLVRGCGEYANSHAPLFSLDLGNSLHWVPRCVGDVSTVGFA